MGWTSWRQGGGADDPLAGWVDRQMDGELLGWTEAPTGIDRDLSGWTGSCQDGQRATGMDREMSGWTARCHDGQGDVRMDRGICRDGQRDLQGRSGICRDTQTAAPPAKPQLTFRFAFPSSAAGAA